MLTADSSQFLKFETGYCQKWPCGSQSWRDFQCTCLFLQLQAPSWARKTPWAEKFSSFLFISALYRLRIHVLFRKTGIHAKTQRGSRSLILKLTFLVRGSFIICSCEKILEQIEKSSCSVEKQRRSVFLLNLRAYSVSSLIKFPSLVLSS